MQIRIAAVLGLLAVSGCRVIEPAPPPAAPRIGGFTASKTLVASGEDVVLSFTTVGATQVELTDDSGNFVQLDGSVEDGTAKVAPVRSAFYVLRATGAGGRDTAFVQIAVNEPLKDLFLIAVPAAIDSGGEGQLLWGAAGASSVTLKTGAGMPQPLTGTTGAISVTPATTEQYTLTAQGAPGTPPLTALAEIQVRPVLRSATLTAADGVIAGETLKFAWTSAGAGRIAVSEQTLGQLTTVTEPSSVANGTFDYVLPATLPNGAAVGNGLPLSFVVSATAGTITISKTISVVVGELPAIERLEAPEFVTTGRRFTVNWKTLNASKITILAGGSPIFETLPGTQARVDQGSFELNAPNTQTEYTLLATNTRGGAAQRTFNVRPVALPTITTYTLTPVLNALGDPATARWTTMDAVKVVLRFENGPSLGLFTTPGQVASGSAVLTPATGGRIALEAYNAAGDLVTAVRTFSSAAGAVTVSPTPSLRGSTATLNWTLAPGGVLEVVGLGTAAPAPISNSANFIDLAASANALELAMPDTTNGSARLALPQNFVFPLLGTVRPNLFVSINGFIAFSSPAALSTNLAISDSSTPTILAPLWDDLSLLPTSKILSELRTAPSGERFLVVQWDKLVLANDMASELTFQAHLYETGQVAFLYKTLTGSLTSVTVGVKDSTFPLAQQRNFNSATGVPVADLELNYFSGGPADGSLDFTATGPMRLGFFGRTATGLVPASADVRVISVGDVSITEVMVVPPASIATTGQWIELYNTLDASVDFGGLTVKSTGSDAGYVIAGGTPVGPYGRLVIGQSVAPSENGGAPVVEAFTDVPLGIPDRVTVGVGGTVIGSLAWDAGVVPPAGNSLQTISGVLLGSGAASAFCPNATTTFGSAGAIGTPGLINESCAPYTVSEIPSDYRTPPMSAAVPLVQIGTWVTEDEGQATMTLPMPFVYFGTPVTSVSLVANGYLKFGAPITNSDVTPSFSNQATPVTTEPNSVVAPFWDDLKGNTGYQTFAWRETDRFILGWDRFFAFSISSTSLSFQAHLLDNGTIEFHYGALTAGSGSASDLDRVTGGSASVWIESPDGTFAIPWSVNQAGGVSPLKGVRFTPSP